MRAKPTPLRERMRGLADRPDDCWIWPGKIPPSGYVRTSAVFDGAVRFGQVHALAYEIAKGPIPVGLEADHLCRNRACFNPAHIEAVTPRVNVLRSNNACARNARKTHCPAGHLLAGANLRANKYGWRMCRTCFNLNMNRKVAEGRIKNRGPNRIKRVLGG